MPETTSSTEPTAEEWARAHAFWYEGEPPREPTDRDRAMVQQLAESYAQVRTEAEADAAEIREGHADWVRRVQDAIDRASVGLLDRAQILELDCEDGIKRIRTSAEARVRRQERRTVARAVDGMFHHRRMGSHWESGYEQAKKDILTALREGDSG